MPFHVVIEPLSCNTLFVVIKSHKSFTHRDHKHRQIWGKSLSSQKASGRKARNYSQLRARKREFQMLCFQAHCKSSLWVAECIILTNFDILHSSHRWTCRYLFCYNSLHCLNRAVSLWHPFECKSSECDCKHRKGLMFYPSTRDPFMWYTMAKMKFDIAVDCKNYKHISF